MERIGNCRLILGDSFDVLPKLCKVDAIITDPPYNYDLLNFDWNSKDIKRNIGSGMITHVPYNNVLGGARDDKWYKRLSKFDKKFYDKLKQFVQLADAIMSEGAFLVQFSDHKSTGFVQASHKRYLYIKDSLVWIRSSGPARGRPASRDVEGLPDEYRTTITNMWESIIVSQTRIIGNTPDVYKRTGLGYVNTRPNGELVTNIFYDKKTKYDKFDHVSVKPLTLMCKLVQMYCPVNRIVLDPFMGTGTTGVACVEHNRKFIGIERDRNNFDIACDRINDAINNQRKKLW